MALVPLLARTPTELVATNVASSTLEGTGTFAGPVIGGVLAGTAGIDIAVWVGAGIYLCSALLAGGIRREGEVAARPRTQESALAELLHGARTLARESQPRLLVLLAAAQSFTRGLLNVLLVVVALKLLNVGDSGLGWLNAALGAGGLIGGLTTVGLVGKRRLAGPFGGLVLQVNGPAKPCTHIGEMLGVEDPEIFRQSLEGRRGAACTVVQVDGLVRVGDTVEVLAPVSA